MRSIRLTVLWTSDMLFTLEVNELSMLDFIHHLPHGLANFFLFFSHFECVIPIILLGLVFRPQVFFQTACLVLIDIVVNVALKGTFKVPLSPILNKIGYAFPSGHMQFATVFYGWLAFNFSWPWLRVIIFVLLFGIGCGLIHYDYHNFLDVTAGIIFGLLLIYLFYVSQAIWFWLLFASFCMLYNAFVYTEIPMHAQIAYDLFVIITTMKRAEKK